MTYIQVNKTFRFGEGRDIKMNHYKFIRLSHTKIKKYSRKFDGKNVSKKISMHHIVVTVHEH